MKIRNDLAISDTGFVFDPIRGESFSLNQIGTEIFLMYKNDNSIDEIIKTIIEKYEVSNTELERTLNDFEGMMKEYNFIQE
jgi:hypothetical protein